jgi:hypothetical protein
MDINALWETICKIHQHSKELALLGEEFGDEFKAFIQPMKELKDAYEHVIRAKSKELDMQYPDEDMSNESYIETNIKKVLSHEYRAFFDIADQFSITVRDLITKDLKPFSAEEINMAIPNYYSDYRPQIYSSSEDIASYRSKKDIGKDDEVIPLVDHYSNACKELLAIYHRIAAHLPSLHDIKQKREREASNKIWTNVSIAIITAVITVILTLLSMSKICFIRWAGIGFSPGSNPFLAEFRNLQGHSLLFLSCPYVFTQANP